MRPRKAAHRRRRRRFRGDRGGEGGFVLTWIAIMLVVLIAFAGVAVDVGNWYYVGNKAQKAADSASLAGAVFLPINLAQGQSIAVDTAEGNGFSAGQGDTVSAVPGGRPNQLRVTVSRPVTNFFLGLLGLNSTTIERTAVAEFQGPIPMGSPDNRLGSDPETGYDPQFWINVAGPNSTKKEGDRYTAKVCPTGIYNCDGNLTPNNKEYSTDGYSFVGRVSSITAGQPLTFQVFDPTFAYVGDVCGNATFPSAAELTTLKTWYSDADTRYAVGNTSWCTGDQMINSLSNVVTTFIVRAPDDTPYNDFDNPVVNIAGQCQPMQTRAFSPGLSGAPTINQLLNPIDGIADTEAVVNSSDNYATNGLTFAEGFRRWVAVCTIPSGSVVTGDYILQIRTNAAVGGPLTYDASVGTGGHNRMALRAGFGTGVPTGAASIFGNGKLPIYANDLAANSQFYLARVFPSGGSRVLSVPLYDMGDAAAPGTLQLLGPDGNPYSPPGGCTFVRYWIPDTVTSANCTLGSVSSGAGYNGQLVEIRAPLPAGYTCVPTNPTDCWFKINASFTSGVNDTTTWQALIIGDPVHLIE